MNIPISCTLSDADRAQSSADLLPGLATEANSLTRVAGGIRFIFGGSAEQLERVTQVIARERRCCKFLTFDVHAEPNDGPILLAVTGPEGTEGFLNQLLA